MQSLKIEPRNKSVMRLKVLYQTQAARRPPKGPKMPFFVPGDFDLWPLTFNSSERRINTSSVWMWRKSVQRFPRYFIHKQKTTDWRAKNRTFRSSLHVVKIISSIAEYIHAKMASLKGQNTTTEPIKNLCTIYIWIDRWLQNHWHILPFSASTVRDRKRSYEPSTKVLRRP